ncbi:MAG TPA: thiosulfate oxidation carrier complex protein SoxZ, partial [Burkholderiaceae bacterium]|nr:thiosulfate oxidation carrier complex protein SoxZ [Burkholderiaceae bacterium]
MADPMRIRAAVAGDKATVRVLMSHEMETGQRKDAAGKTIPAWHITEVTAT